MDHAILWRTIVQGFYPEGVTREQRKVVDAEAELSLGHLITSGRVKKCVGATDAGEGLIVWLTGVGHESSEADPDASSDSGGI